MNRELKKDLFNIYDVIVFEDENGITQDCVCAIGEDKEVDEAVGVVDCNSHSISICENGSYKVWEKDGKDMPYYATNKKIIHLYTLKNDNRFYEIYPSDDYGITENSNLSEALEIGNSYHDYDKVEDYDEVSRNSTYYYNVPDDCMDIIKQALIKAQEREKFFDDMLIFKNGCMTSCFEYKGKQIVAMPLEEYDEFMKQEKALEIIEEKNVNVKLLKLSTNLLDYYTRVKIKTGENTELTEEEYDLLKEVLG